MKDPAKALTQERAIICPTIVPQTQVLATQKFGDVDIHVIKLEDDHSDLWFPGEDIGLALDLAESIRQGSLTLEALDAVPLLQHAVKQIIECRPHRQLTLFPGGAN